jgi:predicted dehydrogenase
VPRKLRIALVGCGGIIHMHIDQLWPLEEAQIAALADPSEASLQRVFERHPQLVGIPRFADYREMLEAVELDAVIIASPHSCHYEQTMSCLERGLHVLTEKPMVSNVVQARRVIEAADRGARVLMIAYQHHYSPIFRHARSVIRSGRLGRITYVAGLQAEDWLRPYRDTWRHDPAISCGGQLNDAGSHLLDVILWVTGLTPTRVFAEIDNRSAAVDILSSLTIRFSEGAIGSVSVVGDAPRWREEISFYGETGALYVREHRLFFEDGGADPGTRDLTDEAHYVGDVDKNFVDSILGRDVPQTPPACGLRVTQLTEAAWRSAESGQPVEIVD